MAGDEYTSAVGGGLKLKGGISKKSKKSKKKAKPEGSTDVKESDTAVAKDPTAREIAEKELKEEMALAKVEEDGVVNDEEEEGSGRGKTEAERKFDEMRRKRLDERLKKDGAKTHKQRVEELNRYLSTLSEHHDMPRIGPG